MNRTTSVFLLLCGLLLTLRADTSFATEPEAATLFGIAKLVVGTDSIEVRLNDSLRGLELLPGKGGWEEKGVESLTAKPGDSFTVSDRHHVSVVYKLLRITDGSATIEVTEFFNFLGEDHRNDRTRHIRAYSIAVSGQ